MFRIRHRAPGHNRPHPRSEGWAFRIRITRESEDGVDPCVAPNTGTRPAEKHGFDVQLVEGHRVLGSPGGARDHSLAPSRSLPFPSLIHAAVLTAKQYGYVPSAIVDHGVRKPGRWPTPGSEGPRCAVPLPCVIIGSGKIKSIATEEHDLCPRGVVDHGMSGSGLRAGNRSLEPSRSVPLPGVRQASFTGRTAKQQGFALCAVERHRVISACRRADDGTRHPNCSVPLPGVVAEVVAIAAEQYRSFPRLIIGHRMHVPPGGRLRCVLSSSTRPIPMYRRRAERSLNPVACRRTTPLCVAPDHRPSRAAAWAGTGGGHLLPVGQVQSGVEKHRERESRGLKPYRKLSLRVIQFGLPALSVRIDRKRGGIRATMVPFRSDSASAPLGSFRTSPSPSDRTKCH